MIESAATVGEALAAATNRLRAAGSDTPRLDAEVLLAHVAGRDRTWALAHPEAPLGERGAYEAAVERRAAGEPVAYIRGFKEWHSLRIRTDPRALIPRPETELLADAAMAEIEARLAGGPVVAWEVATGSGAVALAIGLRFRDALAEERLTLVASDLSREALALAAENLDTHRMRSAIHLHEADLLPAGELRPDVVVANLPYVASTEVDERRGSLGFEPRVALVGGGPDGLDLVRRFLSDLPHRVGPEATAFLETGIGQAAAVAELAGPAATVSLVPDLAGLERVVRLDLR